MTSSVSSASSSNPTATWLADAWSAVQSDNSGGMLGALQNSKNSSGISGFLSNSTNAANAFATIAQGNVQNASVLAAQIGNDRLQQQQADATNALAAASTPPPVPQNNLAPVIYFSDGSSFDTSANVFTRADGTQIDTTTGLPIVDTADMISLANGSYLDTKNNILTLADGTRIDTVTGLNLSTTA